MTEVAAVALNVGVQVVVVPVHAPDHDEKMLPGAGVVAGVSVSVTWVPGGKLAVQVVVEVAEQMIPVGLLVTVPVAADPAGVEAITTVTVSPAVNVAETVAAAVKVTVHAPIPVQLPPQPPKKKFVPAVSVSVTCVPWAKLAVHVVGQLIPAGLLVTVPAPAAGPVTVN